MSDDKPDTTTISGPPGILHRPYRVDPRFQCQADPRIIELECSGCKTRWFVLIPEKNPRGYLGSVKCQCGIDASDHDAAGELRFVHSANKVRLILHGRMR